MKADDWCRSDDWTSEAQREFHSKLKRSRTAFHKAQYCNLKAGALWRSNQPDKVRAAIGLSDMILSNWADDSRTHHVYDLRAKCHESLGDITGAVQEYLRCIELMRVRAKGFDLTAPLDFGWLCITHRIEDQYLAAIECARECAFVFPKEQYKRSAIISIISHRLGLDSAEAQDHAKKALEAASETRSEFRKHPGIGLVRNADEDIALELRQIADQTGNSRI
jgi:hypothetical protein